MTYPFGPFLSLPPLRGYSKCVSRDLYLPRGAWYPSFLKDLLSNLSNENLHSSPTYKPTECYIFPHTLAMSDAVSCGSGGGDDSSLGLRIGSVFIILVGSMTGALFPVLAKRSSWLHVPKPIFEFVLGSFLIFMVIYDHIASQNSLVRESLYGRRLFRVGKFCLTFFSPEDCHSVYPSSRFWYTGTVKSMFVSGLGAICRDHLVI